ncbi:MAG: aminoacetone oxidase family FAD-binding enzyme, partial [Methanothrix sp.]|nr:aminoacetone oxidase family FAD-binding enzyme [Methanothrix sp.]
MPGEEYHPIQDYDLIVIGAGPSGLFCAINSSEKGKKILILEKKNSPGHKLLISGSGQCNITHSGDIQDFLDHYGDRGRFLRPALLGFTNRDLISFFEKSGLGMVEEKGGKIFPESMQSRDVLNILTAHGRKLGLEIKCGHAVKSIARIDDSFVVSGEDERYRSRLLVIATGGCSYPATGSSGDGYACARTLGHSISEIA